MRLTFTMPTQVCSCCGETKPVTEFYAQSYTGLPSKQCKTCTNVKKSVQRHKAKHGKFISKERIRSCGEEPELTLDDWRDVMVYFKGCCAFCGRPEGRSKKDKHDRDHLVAISKGGRTVRTNIIPACRACNRGRGNQDWRTWFRKQPFWTPDQERRIAAWQRGEV